MPVRESPQGREDKAKATFCDRLGPGRCAVNKRDVSCTQKVEARWPADIGHPAYDSQALGTGENGGIQLPAEKRNGVKAFPVQCDQIGFVHIDKRDIRGVSQTLFKPCSRVRPVSLQRSFVRE